MHKLINKTRLLLANGNSFYLPDLRACLVYQSKDIEIVRSIYTSNSSKFDQRY